VDECSDGTDFYLYFFSENLYWSRGNRASKQQQRRQKKLPPTTRQNKINRSHPSTILINENVCCSVLYKIILNSYRHNVLRCNLDSVTLGVWVSGNVIVVVKN
jgi:hypothetical protein